MWSLKGRAGIERTLDYTTWINKNIYRVSNDEISLLACPV